MDVYMEREKDITLQEWLNYVKTDKDLVLEEFSEGINPITKQKLKIKIEGRVLFDDCEIIYQKGHIGCDNHSEKVLAKLKEIAAVLGAEVFE
ncbi:MAG: hypothetical protein NC079_05690 [Clostridium sp.]|nr:hypothetical protein [Acetatifactor muris]MCM1528027.1 hypothetical protein [Bacteroides sp.]MCM1563084.1 hypothetical protein [Clostridium sp.]